MKYGNISKYRKLNIINNNIFEDYKKLKYIRKNSKL